MKKLWLIAEFCSHTFYHGWHLYERDHFDGRRNRDGTWGWLDSARSATCDNVERLLHRLGRTDLQPACDPEDPHWSNWRFTESFARNFPEGIPVWRHKGEYYLRRTRSPGRRMTEAEGLALCEEWYDQERIAS